LAKEIAMVKLEPVVNIIDDDEDVRKSLSQFIKAVGFRARTFGSGQEFLDYYNPSEPGCLLLDVRMPGISGLGLQEKLAEHQDYLPIIFISGHADIGTVVKAFKNGAVDFIQKPFNNQMLLDSINSAIEISLNKYREKAEVAYIKKRLDSLTQRENQVMEKIIEGKTNKNIAFEMDLSPKTIDFHRCNIMEKMGVNSAVQLTKLVLGTIKA
jgi:FixJ family two-component response regulator